LTCALLVVPVILIPEVNTLWGSIAIISVACFAHQGWASNIYTLVSDYYPKNRVATMTSLAGFTGSIGGVLAASAVGNVLELTGSYFVVFMMAGLAYLAAWCCLQIFLPKKTLE
jgi:ACS family hexuronate transporter-like MFS transporter